MISEDLVAGAGLFAAFIITVRTVAHVFLERARLRAGQSGTSTDSARLQRIEQAIEAMAIEVERISEGQRFTTKLLADRAAGSGPRSELHAQPARSITPH
jgi:hypothetical protein